MKMFLSYTRDKDAFNAVTSFHKHFVNELEMAAPGSRVFLDKENISVGDRFPEKIARGLKDADVLIILVSPKWLSSRWCRKEFELFSKKERARDRQPCILPMLWVNTPALKRPGNDAIAKELKKLQYTDWRELRHETWQNPELLKKVAHLAEKAVALVPEGERR